MKSSFTVSRGPEPGAQNRVAPAEVSDSGSESESRTKPEEHVGVDVDKTTDDDGQVEHETKRSKMWVAVGVLLLVSCVTGIALFAVKLLLNRSSGGEAALGSSENPCMSKKTMADYVMCRPGDKKLMNNRPHVEEGDYILLIGDYGTVGDWAYSFESGKEVQVAQAMNHYVSRQKRKPLFIGALGDNFYAAGVRRNDSKWKYWKDTFFPNEASPLFGVPWTGIMGNHDYGNDDPNCVCGVNLKNPFSFKNCNQMSDRNGKPISLDGKSFYSDAVKQGERMWMPHFNWKFMLPKQEKGKSVAFLDVFGLESDQDVSGIGGNGEKGGGITTLLFCKMLHGTHASEALRTIVDHGQEFYKEKVRSSQAPLTLTMQHYPSHAAAYRGFFDNANRHRNRKMVNAFGHTHDTYCTKGGKWGNHCEEIMSGGGGITVAGGSLRGFVVLHLHPDNPFQPFSTNFISEKGCDRSVPSSGSGCLGPGAWPFPWPKSWGPGPFR